MRYKELFSTQEFGETAYAAVIVDLDSSIFYHALMEECHVGGNYSYGLKDPGNPISLDEVKELAVKYQNNDPRRAIRYTCISDDYLKDMLVGKE